MSKKNFFDRLMRRDSQGRILMDIPDKVTTTKILGEKEKRCCPPHRFPHKFPFFGKTINDEECHIHKNKWRDMHHAPFCKWLQCKNYKAMATAKENFKNERAS